MLNQINDGGKVVAESVHPHSVRECAKGITLVLSFLLQHITALEYLMLDILQCAVVLLAVLAKGINIVNGKKIIK